MVKRADVFVEKAARMKRMDAGDETRLEGGRSRLVLCCIVFGEEKGRRCCTAQVEWNKVAMSERVWVRWCAVS